MTSKLMVTLFMLVAASVSYAQNYDDDNVEVVEKNVARDADADASQDQYSKGKMDGYDTKNSPQINIYNANSNANKQNQKAKQATDADVLADAEAAAGRQHQRQMDDRARIADAGMRRDARVRFQQREEDGRRAARMIG